MSNNDVIPEGAVVYDMYLSGVRTSNASYATINNVTQNLITTLGPSIYSVHDIAARGLKADSYWEITIGYKKDTILNPEFVMFFVYPVTSEFIPKHNLLWGMIWLLFSKSAHRAMCQKHMGIWSMLASTVVLRTYFWCLAICVQSPSEKKLLVP